MANGDAAAALGFDLVLSTDDVREGYSEINKSRDYLANHITSGSHTAAQITSGVFATDRLPVVPISKGGTNATTAPQALTNLGAAPAADIATLQAQLDALDARITALEG